MVTGTDKVLVRINRDLLPLLKQVTLKLCPQFGIYNMGGFFYKSWCKSCQLAYFKRRYAEDPAFREKQKQRAKANYLAKKQNADS